VLPLTRHQCNIHYESSRVPPGASKHMGAADHSWHSRKQHKKQV